MITQQTQIKINLPLALKEFIESKAARFGMPLAGYIRYLLLKEVEDMKCPVYEASELTIKRYKRAMKEKDKAIKVKGDIKKFLDNL